MDEKIVVEFNMIDRNKKVDIEIPIDITCKELLIALNFAFELGIDTSDVKQCYLKLENPIALMLGNNLISDYGIRTGSIINF